MWFGTDVEPQALLDGVQKWYRLKRNIFASKSGKPGSFKEMDSHMSHMYDFSNYEAVKCLSDNSGFLWLRTPDSYFKNSDHSAAVFSNAEHFEYEKTQSTEPVNHVIPELKQLDQGDMVLQDIAKFAEEEPSD